ncbi:DUF2000 family protein [Streptomyces regalis]|uniref:DUF2000 domain-containing protein n=1 Tax=Streptomyces regalis TaxID=68262 RepID=A0A117MLW1_9ACTN|nr:DUF2000 family protein [Streptomyces regalis]KUL24296.1 hypothetical protein ADL12_37400 [Streptomyces regalis]
MPELLRTAIAVDKSLDAGAVANASAIVMGQLARLDDRIYADDVRDGEGALHAGIRFNTLVLSGRSSHLAALAQAARAEGLATVLFTTEGQSLSNSFEAYRDMVAEAPSGELGVCAVGVVGEHELVRSLTKRFSVYRG